MNHQNFVLLGYFTTFLKSYHGKTKKGLQSNECSKFDSYATVSLRNNPNPWKRPASLSCQFLFLPICGGISIRYTGTTENVHSLIKLSVLTMEGMTLLSFTISESKEKDICMFGNCVYAWF